MSPSGSSAPAASAIRCSMSSIAATGSSASSKRRKKSARSASVPAGSQTSTARWTTWESVRGAGSVGMLPPYPTEKSSIGRSRRPRTALVENRGEAALERAREDLAHGTLLEALDQLGHEALDDQALGLRLGQPARAEVEELLLVDLRDRRRVCAADVVGEDLEARDRVRVGALGQQQVAALLERVGLLRARVDLDHPAPDRRRAVAQDPAERQIRNRVRRGVLLRRVEVDVLARVRRVGARDLGLGALAGELGLHPHAAAGGAEADGDPVELAVALHLGALCAEDPRLLVQILAADVAELGVLPDDELDD